MRFAFPIAVLGLLLLSLPAVGVLLADLLGYGSMLNDRLEFAFGLSHKLALSLPAAFVFLVVPISLIVLHLLRMKRRPLVVSSTLLWQASLEDHHANALFRWLQRNVSLLLQLLGVMFLLYGILGPRIHGLGATGGKRYILIIDNSASMSATDVKPTRLDWAKAEAIRRIASAGDDDVGMVIAMNRGAEIRQSYTSDREALRAAVRGIRQSAAQSRLDEALQLAVGLVSPGNGTPGESNSAEVTPGRVQNGGFVEGVAADVHLYSDGGFPPVADSSLANLGLEYHSPPVKEKSDNVGIVRLDAGRDEAGLLAVTATVRNYSDTQRTLTARLDVMEGGRASRTYPQVLQLDPNESVDIEFHAAETEQPLRLALDGVADSFSLDDVVWAVPTLSRKARIAFLGPPNPVLDAFFNTHSTRKITDVVRLSPAALTDSEKFVQPARDGQFDLVVFDRCAPSTDDQMPRANTLFIGSRPPGIGADSAGVKNPRIVGWAGAHPITRGLRDLYAVPIADSVRFTNLPPRTEKLIESDANVVLLAGVPRPPFTDLILSFSILDDAGKWNTLWPLEPSFVLFLRNVTRTLGNLRDGSLSETTRPGDSYPLRTQPSKRITVKFPSGRTETLDSGTRTEVAFVDTAELGIYHATDGTLRTAFAVNLLDPDESDLSPRSRVIIGSQITTAGDVGRPTLALWKFAIVAALLVVLAEWWVYAIRVR